MNFILRKSIQFNRNPRWIVTSLASSLKSPYTSSIPVEKAEELRQTLWRSFPNAVNVTVTDISGGCGKLFKIFVECEDFRGLSILKQHRAVTDVLCEQIKQFHDHEYWYEQARIALRKRLQYATDRRPHAKNVILLVGDGMGVSTVTAARIFAGQRKGKKGEEHELAWDTFPAVGLAKINKMNQLAQSEADSSNGSRENIDENLAL
ncbi:alkaline phosphatase [Holotrichia oblita]|uniref:Alkaline phosphatase n=1 Tax=Holotrichia oblita TaxID=644536 RepID=A0ACB9SU45_HOLOL|nr:alkaline phosphatase [Holotrichia oblita]